VAQRAAVRFQCTASLAADPLRPSAGRAAPPASRPLTSRCRDVGPASGSLGPRQPLPARLAPGTQRMLAHTLESGARLRTRLTGGNPHRQGHPHPRLFKARTTRQARDAFRRFGATALRPRWKTTCKRIRLRVVSRHPFTCCDGTRLRPRWWVSASRYPALPERLAAPVLETGKMLLTDFCNRHTTRAPIGSFDPRGDRLAFALLVTSDGAEPQRTARVTTRLTARHELQP
jgi:hypothetical protein